jgi:hypothetical protein
MATITFILIIDEYGLNGVINGKVMARSDIEPVIHKQGILI